MTEMEVIQEMEDRSLANVSPVNEIMEQGITRFVTGKMKPIHLEIDVPDDATTEEINRLAKAYFYNHFQELIDLSSLEMKLHPEGVLTHDAIFVGQIVRCIDLGRIGIVIRHKKGTKRRISVLFSNGEVRLFEPYSLSPCTTAYHKMHFTPAAYKPGTEIEEGVIYDIKGKNEIQGMAVITFNRNRTEKLRVRVNYLTAGNKRNVVFMNYTDLIKQLDFIYSQKPFF